MPDNSRTQKGFKDLASFSKEILVFCPHCKAKASVLSSRDNTIPFPHDKRKSVFRCNNCYKAIAENKWYGPVAISPINKNCGFCGSSLKAEKCLVKKPQGKMKVRCSACGQEKFYEVQSYTTYANDNQATDPYFGLDLWLQFAVDSNTFWAYNFDHLAYLKQYVSAKLREAASSGSSSLVWKLPDFIKLAKNRDKILKGIEKLEQKHLKLS